MTGDRSDSSNRGSKKRAERIVNVPTNGSKPRDETISRCRSPATLLVHSDATRCWQKRDGRKIAGRNKEEKRAKFSFILHFRHFESALHHVHPSVTKAELLEYEDWASARK